MQLRHKAGAAARAMLVTAAAARWQVSAGDIVVRDGVLSHAASGRSARSGELEAAAACRCRGADAQGSVRLPSHRPSPAAQGQPRQDHRQAMFTRMCACPACWSRWWPMRHASAPPYVRSATPGRGHCPGWWRWCAFLPGVAVLARDTWSARKGRDALEIEWDERAAWRGSSDALYARYRELAATAGAVARREGDAEAELGKAATVIEAEFILPFLAHAAMEPMNCVIRLDKEGCEVWNGQFQTGDQHALAALFGLKPEQVRLNMLYAGGGFRPSRQSALRLPARGRPDRQGDRRPRPGENGVDARDDMRAGHYRPLYLHRIRAALDRAGRPLAWSQRIVGQSIITGTAFRSVMVRDGIDATSVEGATNLPTRCPTCRSELHTTNAEVKVPVQWWRSVGSSHTGFATEVFLDELAARPRDRSRRLPPRCSRRIASCRGAASGRRQRPAGKTPLAPREGAAAVAWRCNESFNTIVAQVAEVSLTADGSYTVDSRGVRAGFAGGGQSGCDSRQMEGGIGFALTAALAGEITFDDGKVVQSNFHDYTMLRINQMPKIGVHRALRREAHRRRRPGVPPLAPALVNALFAAGGKRIRRLPIGDQLKA